MKRKVDTTCDDFRILTETAIVGGYEVYVDIERGFAMVSVPGENDHIKFYAKDIDKLKKAIDFVKGMLEEVQER